MPREPFGLSFRYTEPVLMGASCVNCHNHLDNSPKMDWQVGDVRGILEITQPLDDIMLIAQDGLRTTYGVLIGFVALATSGLLLVVGRLRTVNRELEETVADRTSELQRLANVDGLTQLANRRFFDETLEQEWRRSHRQSHPLSLILCDVDHFKQYNDTYGHQAGDHCLQAVATMIQSKARRSGELAARYGGEEFVVILPHVDIAEAAHVADKIRTGIHQLNLPHATSSTQPYVTLSLGVACIVPNASPNASHSPEDLIHAADEALYQAKENGRDRYMLASTSSEP